MQLSGTSSAEYVNCDGSASVLASGGSNPYSYLWDDILQQNTSTAINLCAGAYVVIVTDSAGCTDSLTVNVIDSTGVFTEETRVSNRFFIYPNPFKDQLVIKLAAGANNMKYTISLYDLLGRLQFEKIEYDFAKNNEMSLLLEEIKVGLYSLVISSNNEMHTFPVIKW